VAPKGAKCQYGNCDHHILSVSVQARAVAPASPKTGGAKKASKAGGSTEPPTSLGGPSSDLTRSEIYVETIPLFTSGRVRLLDHKKCVDQFAGLRRKVQPGGREQIDRRHFRENG
jgi:hypothetical protein